MKTVQQLLFEARGVRDGRRPLISRKALVERANLLPGAPDGLSEGHLEALEKGTGRSPGIHVRYFAAAAGIPLVEMLAAPPLSIWPDVAGDDDRRAAFVDLCDRWGLKITSQIGDRFVVEVPE